MIENEKVDCIDALAFGLTRTRAWREKMASRYPADKRNALAVQSLTRSVTNAALSDSDWLRLKPNSGWASESWRQSVCDTARADRSELVLRRLHVLRDRGVEFLARRAGNLLLVFRRKQFAAVHFTANFIPKCVVVDVAAFARARVAQFDPCLYPVLGIGIRCLELEKAPTRTQIQMTGKCAVAVRHPPLAVPLMLFGFDYFVESARLCSAFCLVIRRVSMSRSPERRRYCGQ